VAVTQQTLDTAQKSCDSRCCNSTPAPEPNWR
jgi:hypothetical protein